MSDVTKFVADDHARIRRAFVEYRRTPNNLDAALNVCDTLWIHMTIEVELIQAAVWDELPAADREAMGSADDRVHQLMASIDRLERDDPALAAQMATLSRMVDDHIAAYERYVVPPLARRPDQLELGRQAFRRWQELFGQRTPRTWTPIKRLANTGWGGGGRIANSGW
jgi:hypothetical protein